MLLPKIAKYTIVYRNDFDNDNVNIENTLSTYYDTGKLKIANNESIIKFLHISRSVENGKPIS